MNRRRNTSLTIYKSLTAKTVDRHHRSISQQSTKLNSITNLFTHYRNNTHGGGFLVNHTNSCFIGNNTRNSCSRCSSWDSNHIQTY